MRPVAERMGQCVQYRFLLDLVDTPRNKVAGAARRPRLARGFARQLNGIRADLVTFSQQNSAVHGVLKLAHGCHATFGPPSRRCAAADTGLIATPFTDA